MPISENIQKHSHLLRLYMNTTHNLVNERYKPLPDSFGSFLQASEAIIEKTKHKLNNYVLLDKIQKAVNVSIRCKTFIKKQIIAIKNASLIIKQLYADIASYDTSQKATKKALFTTNSNSPSYNKPNKNGIKLNNKNGVTALSNQSPKNIFQDINTFFQAKNISYTEIHVTQKLKSGNITIHTTNKNKTKKLVKKES